jgi:ABC-type dipeptide/oligopeptide/nickel transport system permease subunit
MPKSPTPVLIFWYLGIVLFLLLGVLPFDLWFDSKISLSTGVSGPSLDHWLGTDNLGRDLLVRLSQSIRAAVLPLWFACLLATFLGCVFELLTIVSRQHKWAGLLTSLTQPIATILVSIPIGVAAFAWSAIQEKAGLTPIIVSLIVVFSFRTMLQIQDFYRHDCQLGYWEAHASMGGNLLQRLLLSMGARGQQSSECYRSPRKNDPNFQS